VSEAAFDDARVSEKLPYSLGEEIANSVIHGIGTVLSIAGMAVLVTLAVLSGDPFKLAASIVYGTTLVLEYAASTLYHAFPMPRAKHVFKILDHVGIYLLIAGSYTPFCLVTLQGEGGWLLFGAVWGLAGVGIAAEAFWPYRPRWLSAAVYLGLGWMVVLAIRPITEALDPAGLWLLVAGGLAYTVGTIFYVLKRIKYMHAVWHVFVLAGSILHYLAILIFVIA
jgi:hemolysin III